MTTKLTVDGLGPRQRKALEEALRNLSWEAKTFVQLTGTLGEEPRSEHVFTEPFGAPRAELEECMARLARRYPSVTPENYRTVIVAAEAELEELKSTRPVRDEREPADVVAERAAAVSEREAAMSARLELEETNWQRVRELAPSWAAAIIYAELNRDTSDPMTDYFASSTERRVALGYRRGAREDFKQLRAAARGFEPTAELADDPDAEHRDNYSMGAGNYLGQNPHWGSGWCVRSYKLEYRRAPGLLELELLESRSAEEPSSTPASSSSSSDGVTVATSSLGRPGVCEIRFPAKPEPEIRQALKSAGFRWAGRNGCWYGRAERVPAVVREQLDDAARLELLEIGASASSDPFGIDAAAEQLETELAGR